MSYCRWSSDDYTCDVYVYEDVSSGWTTHVASNRVVWDDRRPAPVPFDTSSDEAFKRWFGRGREVMDLLDVMPRREIGLPHDGETFSDDTPGECAETLLMLKSLGYNVPQDAIDALRDEQSDLAQL
jgi:hypothetical protein